MADQSLASDSLPSRLHRTKEADRLAAQTTAQNFNLEKIVGQSTWREILYDLVVSEKLDPWNIDVIFITGEYIKRIKKLQQLDLHLSANILLAAAILLRYKSDALRFEEPVQQTLEGYTEEGGVPYELPNLALSDRIPPKRQVTLDELVSALEGAFEAEKERIVRRQHIPIAPITTMNIVLPEFDIESEMEHVMQQVEKNKDAQGFVLFSSIVASPKPLDVIYSLLPTLHLVQSMRLGIIQEKFFGDIILYCVPQQAEAKSIKPKPDAQSQAAKPNHETQLQSNKSKTHAAEQKASVQTRGGVAASQAIAAASTSTASPSAQSLLPQSQMQKPAAQAVIDITLPSSNKTPNETAKKDSQISSDAAEKSEALQAGQKIAVVVRKRGKV